MLSHPLRLTCFLMKIPTIYQVMTPVSALHSPTALIAMATESDDRERKREKLRDFENWPQWADLT